MADFVYNVALGRGHEFARRVLDGDPSSSAFVVVLLQAANSDAVLKDLDTLSAVLGDSSTTEADATGYARQVASGLSVTIDDTNDRVDLDTADINFGTLGGTTNNNLTDLLFTFDSDTGAGTDANIIPVTQHDFVLTTQGTNVTAQVSNFLRIS